jgi:hypothetical protein
MDRDDVYLVRTSEVILHYIIAYLGYDIVKYDLGRPY